MTSEVGNGQVSIFPVFKGFRSKVNSEVSASGATAGRSFEKAFATSTKDLGRDPLKKLNSEVTAASKALSKARLSEQDAAGKVRVAEAALAEARKKGGAQSARAVAADERLASAQRRLVSAQSATRASSSRLKDAQQDLQDATEGAASASELGARKYASGWAGVKQRLQRLVPDAVRDSTNKAEKVADDGGKSAGGRFTSSFKGALGAMAAVFAGAKVKDFFGSSITESANLEQSVGAVDAVFKKSSGQMHVWSKAAANAVGLTKNEYNELGTLIGAQLKNGGTAMDQLAPQTQKLITLGADLSSMFGGTSKEAVEALSSALKGERDPIERYGVSLNEAKIKAEAAALGFKATGGALSDEAKQAATLSLIMKQTTDAHGNFAKEASTFEGQKSRMAAGWSNIKAAIGDKFLPVLTQAATLINTHVLPAIAKLVDGIDFTNIATTLAPLKGFFTEVQGGITAMVAAFQDGGNDVTSSGLAGVFERIGLVARFVSDEVIGSVRAMFAAFQDGGTDVTSSGLAGFFERIGLMARALWDTLGPVISNLVDAFLPLIMQVADLWMQFSPLVLLFQIIQPLLPMIGAMIAQVGTAIAGLLAVVIPLVAQIVGALMPIIMQLASVVFPLVVEAIGFVINALTPLIELLGPILTGIVNALLPVVTTAFGFIAATIQNVVNVIRGIIMVFSGLLSGDWQMMWDGLVMILGAAKDQLFTAIQAIPQLIMDVFSGIGTWLLDSGKALIQGFIDGITSMGGMIGDAVGGLLQKARDFFPFSPAKKGPFSGTGYTTHSGKALAGDFASSIEHEAGTVKAAANKVTSAAQLSGTVDVASDGNASVVVAGAAAGGQPFEVKVYPSKGMDENDLAEKVRRILEELLGGR